MRSIFGRGWAMAVACVAVAIAAAVLAAPAVATFPGPAGPIYFTRQTGSSSDVWMVNSDGSALHQVTHSGTAGEPAVSPDGQKLLYTQISTGPPAPGTSQIFEANRDGSDPQQITSSSEGSLDAAWSPDGGTIAFSRFNGGDFDIYTYRLGSFQPPQQLTSNPADDLDAQYSPDGSEIAYANLSASGSIFTMSASDGSNNTRVTTGLDPNFAPATALGTLLAFDAVPPQFGRPQLFTIAPGGQPSQLVSSGDADTQPSYSPNGAQIVFQREPEAGSPDAPGLYTVNANGSDPDQITHPSGTTVDAEPDWSVAPATRSCGGRTATRVGTDGADVLLGTRHRDVIAGLGGDDVVRGLGGRDIVCGGAGDDELHGGNGADRLRGGSGDDELRGGGGSDRLRGGSGDDALNGAGGRDRCNPGSGRNALHRCERGR